LRLAEFKMRLFVFLAHRFLKWAGLNETKIPPVANSQDSTESGASSRPPEHWQRLFPTGPPEHWLDLFRVKSVPVPAAVEGAKEIANGVARADWSGINDDRPQRREPRLQPHVRRQRRRNTVLYSASEKHAWLNRLRFVPPPSCPEGELHIPDATTCSRASPDYIRTSAKDYTKRMRFVSRRVSTNRMESTAFVSREDVQTTPVNETEYVPGPLHERDATGVSDYERIQSMHSAGPLTYQDSVDLAANELTFAAQTYDHEESMLSFAQSAHDSGEAESNFVPSRDASRELASQMTSHNVPHAKARNDLEIFSAERSAQPSSMAADQKSQKKKNTASSSFFIESRHVARMNSFNQVDSPPRRPTPRTVFDDASTCWPRLPDALVFDFSDEFLVRRDEFETVKRLEREQNGNRWNE